MEKEGHQDVEKANGQFGQTSTLKGNK